MREVVSNAVAVSSCSASRVLSETEASPNQVNPSSTRPAGDPGGLSQAAGANGAQRIWLGGPVAAHDLLSPLCTISFISDWIVDEYSERLGSEAREMLKLLQKSVERVRTILEASLMPADEPAAGGEKPSANPS
jgi:hypothetical protein